MIHFIKILITSIFSTRLTRILLLNPDLKKYWVKIDFTHYFEWAGIAPPELG
jgi:hypothetical protein